jgi:DNA mismatch repair protein MutS2
VGFDLEKLAPTFRLHLGVPGASAAIDVSRRMGLSEEVNQRALELAGGGRTKMDQLLREISDERERLIDERSALEDERAATARAYEETRVARLELDKRAEAMHDKDYAGAMGALRSARQELDDAKAAIKKRRKIDASALREHKAEIDALASAIHKNAPKKAGPSGKAPQADELSVGTEILLPSLGGKGVVLEPPNRGKVLVQVGLMKSKVSIEDLRLAPSTGKKQKKTGSSSASKVSYQLSRAEDPEGEGPMRSADATLDLRGERAHEAVASVDRFIDSSLLCARDAIFIVHGHGTGALRTEVRGHLETHPSVTKWRRGEAREGGDGVTVAWLDS